jgi:glycogen debranching enzyme
MGPFITAYVKVNGASDAARQQAGEWLASLKTHLSEAGLGQISEIFDGDPPHRPGGCIAQAWSVGEILRAYLEDVQAVLPRVRIPAEPSSPSGFRAVVGG